MSDVRLNDKSVASDAAYIYAETASGEQVRISKADLATVVAGLTMNKFFILHSNSEYTFPFSGGTIVISTQGLQTSSALVAFPMYGDAKAGVMNISGDAFIGGDVTTANNLTCWRKDDKCCIRNNFSSNLGIIYTEVSVIK